MDRKFLEEVLVRSARRRDVRTVHLPVLGQSIGLFTQLTNDEQLRLAVAAGEDEDKDARMMTGALKFLLVDDDHQPLLRSFAEAAQFVSALDASDMQVLFETVMEIAQDITAVSAVSDEGVEAGKAS